MLLRLISCLIFAKVRLRLFHVSGAVEVLMLMFIVSPFVASELNNDVVNLVDSAIPPLGLYDGISALASNVWF